LTVTAGSQRFVDVTSQGVLTWISRPQRSKERDLIERLLWRTPDLPLDPRMLADEMGSTVQELTRTLFTLNRQQGVHVSTVAVPVRAVRGLQTDLLGDLGALTGAGGQAALTTCGGLCLAEAGCDPQQAQGLADRLVNTRDVPFAATLHFAREQVTLLADHALDQASATWVSLARRLIHVCGALSFEGRAR
jgi:hypothetical protein